MEVADKDKVDKARLKALGAAGVIEVGNNVQAVFGTQAELLKNDIKDALAGPAPAAEPVAEAGGRAGPAVADARTGRRSRPPAAPPFSPRSGAGPCP